MPNVPSQVKQIDQTTWEIPTFYKKGMLVPGRIIATKKLFFETLEVWEMQNNNP